MTQTITIQGSSCWKCGNDFDGKECKRTSHHGIPRTLKPKQNVSIPMCEKCHKEINKQDINTLKAYAYKILKTSESLPINVKELISKLETLGKKGDIIRNKETVE